MRIRAAALSAALLAPVPAIAAEPVAVEIEPSNFEGEGPTLIENLSERLDGAFANEGMTVDPTAEQRRVHLRIHRRDVFVYDVEIGIRVGDQVVEPGVAPFVCDPCRVLDLCERVEGTVPAIVEAIREHEAPPAAELAPEGDDVEEATTAEGDDVTAGQDSIAARDRPRARALGGVGIAGAVLAVGGLGGMIGGVAMLSRDDGLAKDVEDERYRLRSSYQRPGWIWSGVGFGALAIGATMLAVDLTVLRPRRIRRISASPAVAPTFTGATMRVQF